jgi:exopolysaccharide production protein ExoZ
MTERIRSIELLRGLAAISVMGFHFSINRDMPIFAAIFGHGHIGVDLFFLISGFVIYVSTERDRHPGRFLIRRGFRILPLAWLCTLISYMVIPRFAPLNALSDLLLIPSNTDADPPIYGLHALPVLWSLSYELLFYVVFALALLVRYRGIAASVILIGLVIIGQGTPLITADAQSASLIGRPYFANPMLLYFPIGMLFGFLHLRGLWKPDWGVLLAFGAVSCWILASFPTSYGLTRLGFASVGIFMLLLRADGGRIGTALGAITYAVYLIHPLIEPALGYVPLGRVFAASPAPIQVTVLIIVTLVTATVTHLTVERLFIRVGKALISAFCHDRHGVSSRDTSTGVTLVATAATPHRPSPALPWRRDLP